jgi:Uma2 family endonuclease
MTAVILNLDSIATLTHEQFWKLSLANHDIRLEDKEVEIYRIGKETEVLRSVNELSGEAVLPGFVLILKEVWD